MKNLSVKSAILILVILNQLSCSNDKNDISKISALDQTEIWSIGRQVSTDMLQALQSKLTSSIRKNGIPHSIEVCNQYAPALSDSITNADRRIIEIKRVSFRYRNPLNAPDKYDQIALLYYSNQSDSREQTTSDLLYKISDKSAEYFSYYKPLMIKPLCLNCHGSENQISGDVKNLLDKLYPNDYAKGYLNGQFRGLVRVTISK